ncbi:glycosyltransferase [Actinopolyspora erythraea]|uniref:Glycosyltransferase n=1 Tax=Actinopolyspora erythraea TaxID=414996 RepID=A0A099D345_9ACTN|nr:activator-dependent family glycosyltransferase [Actinopolyspora erythraea]AIS23785.1 6-deoxyerythronolide B TDP-mycarosyl glycosyltransferase [Actinopolyspora erythraea]ASU79085.1 glycosyltransferase [Actinopolyspora erythraea]KGI80578.1 glycosyltransferase [Actinopolyspora erythraea]
MRVLLTSFAHRTHFQGLVPLAWALRTAGHEVRVAGQPALTEATVGAGLTAVPVGANHRLFDITPEAAAQVHRYTNDLDFYRREHELHSWEFLLGMAETTTRWVYPVINNESFVAELVEFAREWRPDLVLWEPFTFAGAVAARACGAAHARLLWGSDLTGYFRGQFQAQRLRRPPEDRPDPLGTWLAELAGRFGVEPGEDLAVGQWSIDQLPASFRLDSGTETVVTRHLPYNGTSVVPEWLKKDSVARRICFTGGFSGLGMAADDDQFARILVKLARFEGEIVVTGSDLDASSVPENVRLVDFVSMNVLLQNCMAIIHHGGAGTWATALHRGIPQISVAHEWDCVLRGQRTAELGAGIYLRPDEVDADTLANAVTRLVENPTYAENAAKLRDETLNDPTPQEIVPQLEELAHRYAG